MGRCRSFMKNRKLIKLLLLVICTILVTYFLLLVTYKEPFVEVPLSTAVFDKEGSLLGARVASDGQWRFGLAEDIPEKYLTCVVAFEDRHFFRHPGVNPAAILRALKQNIKAGEVVSGGSTISMQVIRMSRNKSRTVWHKFVEMVLAVQLETRNSKADILKMYASQAPFGGNVVGLEAASWRYFGRPPVELSWAEAATLAVLPNAPSLIHPGRNREALGNKRDRLLGYLLTKEVIDSIDFRLAVDEDLPLKPLDLPKRAEHLVDFYKKRGFDRVETNIDSRLQDEIGYIAEKHQTVLRRNYINNMAVLVLDNLTGQVLAYLGNTSGGESGLHGQKVDIIHSSRSSGSILKPILFASMLDVGEILPGTLIPDIPTRIAGFTPHNFNKEYDGAVHANEALIRSLNVPAVRMLRQYGVQRFYDQLKEFGLSTLHRPADDYGLSLILGGAEVCLWEMCHLYANWAKNLSSGESGIISQASLFLTLEAMKMVKRPESEFGWENFQSSRSFAWKTGTSFGFRDAWAIGVNPQYTIGVWVGNADGEGRPGLTGVSVAAPVLFEVANLLPQTAWFDEPIVETAEVYVCRESGMLASQNCVTIDTIWVPKAGLRTAACPYHQHIAFDKTRQFRVHGDCYPVQDMEFIDCFVLSPAQAAYYSKKKASYKPLPPWLPGCSAIDYQVIDVLYPHPGEELFVSLNASGEREDILFEVVHQYPTAKLFWFLDEQYLGSTQGIHKMGLKPDAGIHTLNVSDGEGNSAIRTFTILRSR